MKTKTSTPSTCATPVSLHNMVTHLQATLVAQAATKKSFIVNDIDKAVTIDAEENTLAFVIGSLLSNAVNSTSDCCIRVETVTMADQLQIRIRNNSAFIYSSYIHIPGSFVDAATKIGGNIGLETEENSALTLVFSLSKTFAA